ncbi:YiiX/YebB-like N1pC/P60 family cysteine hydrolase [Luteolibacter sp. AS25]|uniref:YiiX/YebB-like N1pC/P60 family cysteine hydrolase n=1 Tax=Luteolibacter sp. AS25 TaxID=3135776 RepID=UPI00398BBB2D
MRQDGLEEMIDRGVKTLLAVAEVVPRRENLDRELGEADAAEARGYYLPDEDERLREVFARYLQVRASIREVVAAAEPWVDRGHELDVRVRLRIFTVGFTAACLLIRTGSFLMRVVDGRSVLRQKLDEAEPRYGIPRKSLYEVYRLQSSVPRMWKFHQAWRFYDEYRGRISELAGDELVGEILTILEEEKPFMETSLRGHVLRRYRYRLYSWMRRNKSGFENTMFQLFEIGGRTISELRDPTTGLAAQPKRVPGAPLEAIASYLQPGDIIVTRHQDALTNLFLPGFWPHAALYVGKQAEGGSIVEAKKDGVRLRDLEETLAVDAFLVLRAKGASEVDFQEVVKRALSHVGKLYDFVFDFRQADRLACTEVVYRSWHGVAGMKFRLGETAGRFCLPAEELISQVLESGIFELTAFFGPGCREVSFGETANKRYLASREG